MIKTKNLRRQRGIREKILKRVLILVMTALIVLGGVSCYLNYSSTNGTLKNLMLETVKVASERIEWEITSYKDVAKYLGTVARFSNIAYTHEDKQELIDQKVKEYNLVRGKFISADGIAHIDGTDYNDRDYFKRSMEGEVCVADPIIAKTSGELSIIISAPVWKDGISGSEIIGVVFLVPQENFLNEIVSSLHISEGSFAYMLNSQGNVIAHKNMEFVENKKNTINESNTNKSLKVLGELESKMIAGESGVGYFQTEGDERLLAYSKIEKTDGWSIGISTLVKDFMSETYLGIIITIIIIIAAVLITWKIVYSLAKNISNPITLCANRLEQLSQGDLHTEVPDIHVEDETGILATATVNIVGNMNDMINDIKYILEAMSQNDFTVQSKIKEKYIGDYGTILSSMETIKNSLSNTMKKIDVSANQVSTGSGQMAMGAQNLAEGASEQAAAVEELLSSIKETSSSMEEGTNRAIAASSKAQTIREKAQNSDELMRNMTGAMKRISNASEKIGNIIQAIEEIATETNLLSLNASIESARAGEAGKGFAVVAAAISSLAKESSKSVEDTRKLIETEIFEIENGNTIVTEAGEALSVVIHGIQEVVEEIKYIADSAKIQQESIEVINHKVAQISNVVESNSAAAEESSAMSEELSAQAESLSIEVNKFKIK